MKHNPQKATENSSTPSDMVRLLEWFYLHRNDNTFFSFVWHTMADCFTGMERIAAVQPEGSILVHKTGSGFPLPDGGQDRNDVGIILLPDGSHMSIAVFVSDAKAERDVAAVAEQCMLRIQADAFLQDMPSDLQQKQTSAMLKAIGGDND